MKLVLTGRDSPDDVKAMLGALSEHIVSCHMTLVDAAEAFAGLLITESVSSPHEITSEIMTNTAASNLGIPMSQVMCLTSSAKVKGSKLDVISINDSFLADLFDKDLMLDFNMVLEVIYFSKLLTYLEEDTSKAYGSDYTVKDLPGVMIAKHVSELIDNSAEYLAIYQRIKYAKEREPNQENRISQIGNPTNSDLNSLVELIRHIPVPEVYVETEAS